MRIFRAEYGWPRSTLAAKHDGSRRLSRDRARAQHPPAERRARVRVRCAGEEFGITKALAHCEAELRPQLPSSDAPVSAALSAVFDDDSVLLAREAESELVLVLSRDVAEFDVAKRRRG
jgi:hypothetical protein